MSEKEEKQSFMKKIFVYLKKVYRFLGKNTPYSFLANIGLVLVTATLLLSLVFKAYLPVITDHNETVIIPNLRGLSFEEGKKKLEELNLRWEVYDSSSNNFTSSYPPLTILDHMPSYGDKVKNSRKVYFTLNPSTPPLVRLPNLMDGSVRNAQIILGNYDLKIGKVSYTRDVALNAVLELTVKGEKVTREELDSGYYIEKGSVVNIIAGDGFRRASIRVPKLIGLSLDQVDELMLGLGLKVGKIKYVETDTVTVGTIVRQYPPHDRGRRLRVKSEVDIWVENE